jgi:hypothetical protein
MKAIAHTVWLLLAWSPTTRWLLAVGLALSAIGVIGLLAAWPVHPILNIMAIIGVITAVISPVLMGGTVFRALSAPRTVQFIPHGRLKLLLGALSGQLLLTAFIAGVVTTMAALAASGGIHAPLFVAAFALLTLQFIGSFAAARWRAGVFLWLISWAVWAQLFTAGFKYWHLRDILASQAGLGATVGVTLLAWAIFAIPYLRVRQIVLPLEPLGSGRRPPAEVMPMRAAPSADSRFTHAQAIPVLLSGMPRERRAVILRALSAGLAVSVVYALFNALRGHWNNGSLLLVMLCLFAGPGAGSWAGVMAQGAKALWFHAGLSRAEVFAELEIRGWRVLLGVTALCMALAACWFAVGGSRAPAMAWSPGVLATPLASGALFLYAQLQYVRGRRPVDLLLVATAIALWAVEFFTMLGQRAPTLIAFVLGAQILFAVLLRALARRRWGKIDWLVHKDRRQFWGLN